MSSKSIWGSTSSGDVRGGDITAIQVGDKRLLDVAVISGGTGGTNVNGSGTDQFHTATREYLIDLTPGNSVFLFRIMPQSNFVEASVRDVTFTLERFV